MKISIPTRGQRERELSQRIQGLYSNQLGHRPAKVTCQLFDDSLAIVMEDSITPAEQLLVEQGQEELAQQVRSGLDDAIEPKLKELIEEVLEVKVVDLMGDATLKTGRSGIVVVLSNTPEVRNPDAIPKAKPKASNGKSGNNSSIEQF